MRFLSKINKSILLKYVLSLVLPIAVVSIIFSIVLYSFATNIINQHVIVQFEKSLGLIMKDTVDDLDLSLVKGADEGDKDKYNELLEILTDSQQSQKVEAIYALSSSNGKEHIIALSNADEYGSEYPFTNEMKKTLQEGKTQLSDIYEDEFGVHKSIFTPIEGTEIILGIDMDASFIKDLQSMVIMLSIVLTIIFIILGTIMAYFISKRITNPIQNVLGFVNLIASGDLTVKDAGVKTKDEIGQLAAGIQGMAKDLNSLIFQVADNAEQVAATSEELTASTEQTSISIVQVTDSIQEVAAGADNQAINIEIMHEGVQEISKGMQKVAENANEVTANSVNTANVAEKGSKVVSVAMEKIKIINQTIGQTSEVINRLSNNTREIGDIVSLITEITDQTNLLALNASIEAARAGEHGKGFAVVAEEVRKLAEQSRAAAKKIGSRIEAIQHDSSSAAQAMNTGQRNLQEGVVTFEDAGQAFKEILTSIALVSTQMKAVNSSISEMNNGIHRIAQSTEELTAISSVTSEGLQTVAASAQEQSATITEVASSAHTLSLMAEELQSAVLKFKLVN